MKALDNLCASQRRVFVMYEIQERSVSDIALVENCPPKTVFSRLYAARKHLLGQLQIEDDRLCLGLTITSGRWIDTVGVERALLPTLSNTASPLLTVSFGKTLLALVGVASLAVCFATIMSPFSEAKNGRTVDVTFHNLSILHSDAPVLSPTLAPSISFSTSIEKPAKTPHSNPSRKPLQSAPRARRLSVPPEGSSSTLDRELGEEEDVDIIVFHTGQLDRMQMPSDLIQNDQRATIINPFDRDYTELADLTEQQLFNDPAEK